MRLMIVLIAHLYILVVDLYLMGEVCVSTVFEIRRAKKMPTPVIQSSIPRDADELDLVDDDFVMRIFEHRY